MPYTAMDDGGNSDSDKNGGGNNGGGCGSDGQPVCTGDDLIGARPRQRVHVSMHGLGASVLESSAERGCPGVAHAGGNFFP